MATAKGLDSTPKLPAPPSPSADAAIAPSTPEIHDDHRVVPDVADIDIFTLKPVGALKILCVFLEALVQVTGDVPPTPPVSRPSTPRVGVVKQEDEAHSGEGERLNKRRSRQWVSDDGDLPHRARTPIGSPEARPTEPVHIEIVDPEMESLVPQHLAVARKFYSKKPPPISLEEYLMRLHRFCPMSTAVYIATSLYVHRIAVIQKLFPVTPRNVHRLVLAGLRVAMKALEDLSYPHSRFAKVGGVTEAELGRLEVSFCFVTNFELRVTSEMLLEHVKVARDGASMGISSREFQPRLPVPKRNVESRPQLRTEAPAAAG